ncbi:hypothetical protein [Enterobacter sp. 302C9]|uniref:hypothetical protein n=1 Tax=Enterobacter sp. 302C9 TaxID=3077766 RepID=UPI002A81426C|nr:hypothetical protein [Enterobacter sp. 302C9]
MGNYSDIISSQIGFSYGGIRQVGMRRSDASSSDASMDGRVARIESDISYIKRDIQDIKGDIKDVRSDIKDIRTDMRTDFRITFGALIAVALGLAGIMARGFGWM